jgi:outer membrane receptor protein involved in Fe transport
MGGITSEGIDVQVDWRFDVGAGGMSLSVLGSFLDEYSETAFQGAIPVDFTGTVFNSSFDYKTFTTLRYDAATWSLGLRWQHLPSLDPQPGSPSSVLGVDAHDQFDLFSRWNFRERYELRAGIDNLTNEDPEVVGASWTGSPATSNNALGSTNADYDTFGRRVFIGLSVAF